MSVILTPVTGGRTRRAYAAQRPWQAPRSLDTHHHRDIDTLVATGLLMDGERGLGYLIREPIFLPPINLSFSEPEALHSGATARRLFGKNRRENAVSGRLG